MPAGQEREERIIPLKSAVASRQDVGFSETRFIAVVRVQKREEVTAEELKRAEQIFQEVNPNDSLGVYLAEMKRDYPRLLTAKDEIKLAKIMEEGRRAGGRLARGRNLSDEDRERLNWEAEEGERARETLTGCNWRLVLAVALRYKGSELPLLDRIQEGTVGLMKATDKFDYHLGYKFSTYATWRIRQAISRALADQGRLIRLPVHISDRVRKVLKTSGQLTQEYGREPTAGEIASRLKLSVEKVEGMLRISRPVLSLDEPTGEKGDSNLGNIIEDRSSLSPADETYHNLLEEKLEEILNSVTPREKRILEMRFGLHDSRSYTLAEVGERFGLTRERIRQIEKKAIDRLRHPSRARHLRDYLPRT
jgi:RNA polymerase primary sigma factor